MNTDNEQQTPLTESTIRRQHRGQASGENRYARLRNLLNGIFMLGALIGVGIYFFHSETVGIIVILSSMVFKFVECVFRLMK